VSIPTPYTVQREPLTPGATDGHGNPVDAWGAPVDVPVHGWAPPSPDREPAQDNRDLVLRDLDMYAPAGTTGSPGDRWTLPDGVFEQVGHPEDYTHGPWANPVAGVRISLKRVEG